MNDEISSDPITFWNKHKSNPWMLWPMIIGMLLFGGFFAAFSKDESERRQAGKAIALNLIILCSLFGIVSCSVFSTLNGSDSVSGQDSRAYQALRAKGWNDADAKKIAPSVRNLCETHGGKDCQ